MPDMTDWPARVADLEQQLAERTVERDEARRDADARIALTPEPHRHTFFWSSGTAPAATKPPDLTMCACGVTYGQVQVHA